MSGVQGAFDDRGTRLYAMSGYTGHKHGVLDYDNPATLQQDGNGKIPGYGGHIPAAQSENMFGKTYGNITRDSANKNYVKGIEAPPEEMYKSQAMQEHQNQTHVKGRTAAETVGVIREDEVFEKPLDPASAYQFFGIQDDAIDEIVKEQELKKNSAIFYGVDPKSMQNHTLTHIKKDTSMTPEEMTKQFYGIEEKKELKLGNPIPGYSGVVRRVQADNVFGMTYAEARRRADDSQVKIDSEKRDTLKMNSTFLPAYKRPKEDDELF